MARVVGKFELLALFRLSNESLKLSRFSYETAATSKRWNAKLASRTGRIRRQLDEVITEMGIEEEPKESDVSLNRQEILARLSRGEIDVQEATQLLSLL